MAHFKEFTLNLVSVFEREDVPWKCCAITIRADLIISSVAKLPALGESCVCEMKHLLQRGSGAQHRRQKPNDAMSYNMLPSIVARTSSCGFVCIEEWFIS